VPSSTVLSIEEEAIVLAFRRHTLLPLDDCLYALQATIPHLTRSSLHRRLQRRGISRLSDTEDDKPRRSKFKTYSIGYFHIDIAEVQTAEGKLRLFVAIDRTSKFAYVELHQQTGKMVAAEFLRRLIETVPYKIHTILTDNGIQFAISNRRLLAFNENGVTFRYKDYRRDTAHQQQVMTLATDEFIRRFMLHVLPRGFHRIRHYGLLASSSRKASLARVRELLKVISTPAPEVPEAEQVTPPPCPCCGGPMVVIQILP